MTTSVIQQARVSISLFPFGIERSSVERIIASHDGCSDPAEVTHAVQWLISLGDVEDDDGWLKYTGGDTVGTEMESCLTVADAYRIRDLERLAKARKEWKRHVRWARVRGRFGRLWDRIWPPFCFLIVIAGFTCGLRAQEGANVNITLDKITAAVCAVETGTTYRGFGNVSGRWSVGRAGERGPWQVSPMVLSDMGQRSPRTVGAYESAFRDWYAHLLRKTGSHDQALAAYHRGLGGRHRKDAKAYAQRVLNYAGTL